MYTEMCIFIVNSVSWGSDCSGVLIQIGRCNHGVGTYLTMYEDGSVLLFFSLLKREPRNPITYHLGYDLKDISTSHYHLSLVSANDSCSPPFQQKHGYTFSDA